MISLATLICFIIGIVTLPSSIILTEGCDIIEKMITNQNEFDQYTTLLPMDVSAKLKVCIHEDGDVTRIFDVKSALNDIDQVSKSLDDFKILNPQLPSNDSVFLTKVSKQLNFSESAIATASGENVPEIALTKLNSWSDYSVTTSDQKLSGK